MSHIRELRTDILVIGGGAAGLAAATGAASSGASVLLADERPYLGGILPQCIHKGFGRGFYGEDLTGPEYCEREIERFKKSGAACLLRSHVSEIQEDRTVFITNPEGVFHCSFRQCVLATGCREQNLYSLPVSGTRPAGIFTAGEAQEMMNLGRCNLSHYEQGHAEQGHSEQGRYNQGHYDIGSRVVILGSGDIGQIVARRLILNGRRVVAMVEIKDHLGGILRNQRECVRRYNIPVVLRSTVTKVHGFPKITGVTLRHLDLGTEEMIPCDTLITALGLLPETSIADQLRSEKGFPEWLHLCGNSDHVHEIVDSVTTEGYELGRMLTKNIWI